MSRIARPADTKTSRLNEQTPGVTRCAWPGCDQMYGSRPGARRDPSRPIIYNRVGILCWNHADLVADAVLQDRLITADYMHHEMGPDVVAEEIRERDAAHRARERAAQVDRVRGDNPGFVYYLQVGDRIKIGYSTDVKKRMRAYPPDSKLLAVEGGSPQLEAQRHREFAGSLVAGREWFRPDSVLLEHIDRTSQMDSDGRQFAHHYRTNRQPMRTVRRRKYR